MSLCGFFELVGTLLYRGYIDLVLVYDVFGVGMVKEVWEKMEPISIAIRREKGGNTGVGCEYLYNELMKKEPQLKKAWAKASILTASDSNLPNESSR